MDYSNVHVCKGCGKTVSNDNRIRHRGRCGIKGSRKLQSWTPRVSSLKDKHERWLRSITFSMLYADSNKKEQ